MTDEKPIEVNGKKYRVDNGSLDDAHGLAQIIGTQDFLILKRIPDEPQQSMEEEVAEHFEKIYSGNFALHNVHAIQRYIKDLKQRLEQAEQNNQFDLKAIHHLQNCLSQAEREKEEAFYAGKERGLYIARAVVNRTTPNEAPPPDYETFKKKSGG